MTRQPVRAVTVAMIMALAGAGCSSASSTDSPSPSARAGGASSSASGAASAATPSAGGSAAGSPNASGPSPSRTSSARAEQTPAPATGSVQVTGTIAQKLNVPWGLALLPDGDLLVTSRDTARITRIDLQTGQRTVIGRIPEVVPGGPIGGEGGLLGIAVPPTFDRDRHLYLYYSTNQDNRIARVDYRTNRPSGDQLLDSKIILDGIPHGTIHNGGRLAFGPDGMLYAGTGESGDESLSQDLGSLGGKILRITPDGQPAPGNPFKNSPIWTYGHRNVQGLAWDPTGRMWASEFGDRLADELNLIKKGRDYGWPATQGRTDNPRYTSPVAQWGTEVDSPSGIAYAGGSIWMAALRGERLWRIPLDGAKAGRPQAFLVGRYGRLRSVIALNDHTLLLTTSNTDGRGDPGSTDDRILRLTVR